MRRSQASAQVATCRTCVNQFRGTGNVQTPVSCSTLAGSLYAIGGIAFTCDPVYGTSANGLAVTACADVPYSISAGWMANFATNTNNMATNLMASVGATCPTGFGCDSLQFYSACGQAFTMTPINTNPTPFYYPPPPPNGLPISLPPPPPYNVPVTSSMCTVCVNQLRQSSTVPLTPAVCNQLAFNLFDITPINAPFACDPNQSPGSASNNAGATACAEMDYFTSLAFLSALVVTYRPAILMQKQGLSCSALGVDEFQVYSSCGNSFTLNPNCFLPPAPTVFSPPPPPPPPPPQSPPSPPLGPANKKKKPPPPPPTPVTPQCTVCVSYNRLVNPTLFTPFSCETFAVYMNTLYMSDLKAFGTTFSCPSGNGLSANGLSMTVCALFYNQQGVDSRQFVNIFNNVQDGWKALALWGGQCQAGVSDMIQLVTTPSVSSIQCGSPLYFVPPGCQQTSSNPTAVGRKL